MAVEFFRETGGGPDKSRRVLLAELFKARRFAQAYEVRSSGRDAETGNGGGGRR